MESTTKVSQYQKRKITMKKTMCLATALAVFLLGIGEAAANNGASSHGMDTMYRMRMLNQLRKPSVASEDTGEIEKVGSDSDEEIVPAAEDMAEAAVVTVEEPAPAIQRVVVPSPMPTPKSKSTVKRTIPSGTYGKQPTRKGWQYRVITNPGN